MAHKVRTYEDFTGEELAEITKAFEGGYKTGCDWLAKGRWNFVHPLSFFTYDDGTKLYGYIPGGSQTYTKLNPDSNVYDTFPKEFNKAWRIGYIKGINQYVLDNNLNYPQIDVERA